MAPRKVLLLINTLRIGGTERNVALICQHIDRSRFEPEVWVLHAGGEWEATVRDAGVKVRNLDRRWPWSPRFSFRAAYEIAQSDADIVHVLQPAVGFYAAVARKLFGSCKPMILSVGNSHPRRYERSLCRWFSRCYDRTIANSVSVQKMLCGLGFDRSQVAIIPNGHDCQRYRQPFDREGIRRELGIETHERMLISVGRLIDSKRTCDAIDALGIIRSRGHRAKLVIVGDGPERSSLEQKVRSLSLAEAVTFAGKRSGVINLLRSSDLFLFPSESEGLSNAIIEACLAQLPIVACSAPGVADIVRHGEQALLVAPRHPQLLADAVDACLRRPQLAAALAAAAHEKAIHSYSIEEFLPRLYQVYDDVVGRRNARLDPSAMLESYRV